MWETKRISELEKEDGLIFLSDWQEVIEVKKYLMPEVRGEFDSFFVRVEDGEYTEIWGMMGIIPYNHKVVYKVK